MNLLEKILLKLKIFLYHPVFAFYFVLYYFKNSKGSGVNFYTNEEVKEKIRQGKSIIRYGDGETTMMLGGYIFYQKYNESLSNTLKKIVQNYTANTNYCLSVPDIINEKSKNLKKRFLYTIYTLFITYYKLYFKKDIKYVDAFIFYKYNVLDFIKYIKEQIVIVVPEKQKNMIIEGSYFNEYKKCFKNIDFIIVKAIDSYDEKDYVLKKIREFDYQNTLFLFSCGPSGKAFIYDISSYGAQGIDLGHGISWFWSKETLPLITRGESLYSKIFKVLIPKNKN